MKRLGSGSLAAAVLALAILGIGHSSAQAVELLINGDLESAVGPRDWTALQTVTGLPGATVNASEQISFANQPTAETGELGIFLRPFAGNQGTYADQNQAINYFLSQTTPLLSSTVAGQTFTLTGWSYFAGDGVPGTEVDDGYSGGVTTLHAMSPSGAVPSPTDTTYEMTFLNISGGVLGTTTVDLTAANSVVEDTSDGLPQQNDAIWRKHSVSAVAPPLTRQVRVRVAATNMVDNNGFQNAYLDNYSLRRSGASTLELLLNAELNTPGEPNGYVITETPMGTDNVSFRDFANHTLPSGEQGMWLRSFEGGDGMMSQTVAGTPGADYTFSVWSKWETGYSGGDPFSSTETFVRMEFLDGSSVVIGSPVALDLKRGLDGDIFVFDAGQQTNDLTWRQYTLPTTIAPAGTASVRISAGATGMLNSGIDPQSAFFDDFSLMTTFVAPDDLLGDFNGDDVVDAADYVTWRANETANNPLPNDDGVGNQAARYALWTAHFGETAPGGGSSLGAVPEPSSAVLLVGMALGMIGLGRRRGR